MRKTSVENLDGKTKEERETCFPACGKDIEKKGAGMR